MLLSATTNIKHAALYAATGYDAIDVSFCRTVVEGTTHDSILDGDNWLENIDREKERIDKLGLSVQSIHMPYKYQFDEPNFPWKYEMMCRSLIAAEMLGAKWAVMHMKPVDNIVPMLLKMYEETKVTNVGIAFEKSSNKKAEDLLVLHDSVQEAGLPVGICMDVGHFHNSQYYEYDVVEWIYKFGSRIKVLHMHDNFRLEDSHALPFIGSMPWEQVMCALKDVGYSGNFNYEVGFGGTPEVLWTACLRYCKEIATYLIRVFDEHTPISRE